MKNPRGFCRQNILKPALVSDVSDLAFGAEVGFEDPLRYDGQVLPLCPGQAPPFSAVKRPARPYKSAIFKTDLLLKTLRAVRRPGRAGPMQMMNQAWTSPHATPRNLSIPELYRSATPPGQLARVPHSGPCSAAPFVKSFGDRYARALEIRQILAHLRCIWSFRHHSIEKDCSFPFKLSNNGADVA